MILSPYRYAASGGGVSYFNPLDKGPKISLSADNKVASFVGTNGWQSVRSVTSHTTGKRYAELENTTHNLTYLLFGVCTSAHTMLNFVGSASTGWGLHCNKSGAVDGYTNSVATNLGGTAITAGGRAYIAVDFDAGEIFFGVSTSGWLNGADPSAGTSPNYTFTPNAQLFLGASIFGSAGQTCTLKNQTGENAGTIPTGFSMWG